MSLSKVVLVEHPHRIKLIIHRPQVPLLPPHPPHLFVVLFDQRQQRLRPLLHLHALPRVYVPAEIQEVQLLPALGLHQAAELFVIVLSSADFSLLGIRVVGFDDTLIPSLFLFLFIFARGCGYP